MAKKLRQTAGFTLTELLCTIVVLVLVSACVALGVSMGQRVYAKSVSYSEAQVLCSTLKTTMSDELRYSGTMQVEDGVVGFFSQKYGGEDAYAGFTTDEKGQVLLGGHKLLPSKAYPYGIRAAVEVSYDEPTQMFDVTITIKNRTQQDVLAKTEFQVKKLNTNSPNDDTMETG